MKNLRKKSNVTDSVEAYACMCAYSACSCNCYCVCACSIGNPMYSDSYSDADNAAGSTVNYITGDSANNR